MAWLLKSREDYQWKISTIQQWKSLITCIHSESLTWDKAFRWLKVTHDTKWEII